MLKDIITPYLRIKSNEGKTLSTLYRFQNPPEGARIYPPHIFGEYDSLLNHKVRLCKWVPHVLDQHVSGADIKRLQHIMLVHDVHELVDGDVSRLVEDDAPASELTELAQKTGLSESDLSIFADFEVAHRYLEKKDPVLPENPLSLIARALDSLDGNYFAFVMLTHYMNKIKGNTVRDEEFQKLIDKCIAYVHKLNTLYRYRFPQAQEHYARDIMTPYQAIALTQDTLVTQFGNEIERSGYRVW